MSERAMNVLLVEDNEGDVELAKIAFRRGAPTSNLVVVHDGQDAVEYLYRRGAFADAARPDIVLVDLNMPRLGGKAFLDIVKNDEDLKTIPVMMLTSSQAPAEIMECYKRHANCYILKPTGLDALIHLTQQLESFWKGIAELPQGG